MTRYRATQLFGQLDYSLKWYKLVAIWDSLMATFLYFLRPLKLLSSLGECRNVHQRVVYSFFGCYVNVTLDRWLW